MTNCKLYFYSNAFKLTIFLICIICLTIYGIKTLLPKDSTHYYGSNNSVKRYGRYVEKIDKVGKLIQNDRSNKSVNPNSKMYGTYVEKIDENCLKNDCVYDEKFPNIWAREKIHVRVIPDNEVEKFKKKTLVERMSENDIRKDHAMLLPPPIITVWAYELGFALAEGRYLL